MSMLDWAKNEIKIACERERAKNGTEEGEFDYGCACYESALKAYESLLSDEHSGFSIKMTQNILNRLINDCPLTPIEDTDDVWEDIGSKWGLANRDGLVKQYQCKRITSLFKDVYEDGRVEYSDVSRFICVDMNDPDNAYFNSFVAKIVSEYMPISFPYWPYTQPIKIYTRELLTDPKNGDYDTIRIHRIVKPDGKEEIIDRYFKEGTEDNPGWVEIDLAEYMKRLEMHHRLERERNE